MAGRDITEGRSGRAIAMDVGVVSTGGIWQNTDVAYDVAIGGLPFIYAVSDARPYIRETAPFKKDQFDNATEPGEQSLTGWWIRSQSSFHAGSGIKFYDPSSGEVVAHRFADSRGVNVWTRGEVTMLRNSTPTHLTTGSLMSNGRSFQSTRSIKWNSTDGVLLWDEYDVDKISSSGAVTHFINYNSSTAHPVYAICDDGTYAYWVTNVTSGVTKMTVYKKPLSGSSSDTSDEVKMFDVTGTTVTNAVMEFTKERIILAANNAVYEFAPSATALPSPVYTHPSSGYVFTSITSSGAAIYVSGYNGIQSSIFKFTLNSSGVMPTLTSAVVAAELPVGEIVHKIFYYLGYMMIGTNKGVRAANVSDADGSISYGPLIVTTTQACYDFAARDRFVWCATSVAGLPGTIRIDLGNEIEPLRFSWANDVYYDNGESDHVTTSCAFMDGSDRLCYTTAAAVVGSYITNKSLTSNVATLTTYSAHGRAVGDYVWISGVDSTFNSTTDEYQITAVTTYTFSYAKTAGNVSSTAVSGTSALAKHVGGIYIEDSANLMETGYLTTGNIRFNTLEKKHFERLLGRGNFTYGSLTLNTIAEDGTEYDHITYDSTISSIEVTTEPPYEASEYIAYKFFFQRDAIDTTQGPVFKGYQGKALIATKRHRILQFPVYCYDTEEDRYNLVNGYEGRAWERIQKLEAIEESGDVVIWQDLTTGEQASISIEKISFTRMTPPDKRFDGFGGILTVTIRTL